MRVGAGFQQGSEVGHQLFKLRTGGVVGDTQREAVEPTIPQGNIVDGGTADGAVGQDVDGFVQRTDLGGTEIDVHHFALDVADLDPVADGKGAVEDDDHAAEEVFGDILRGQRDGQADKTGTGDDAADGQAAFLCDGCAAKHNDQNFVHLVQQGVQGAVGAHLLAAGGQQQAGQIRGVVEALRDEKGQHDPVGHGEETRHPGCETGRPRQAVEREVQAGAPCRPLCRPLKAAQQDLGGGQTPAVRQQPRKELPAETPADGRTGGEKKQGTYAPGTKGRPAFQQHRPKREPEGLDRKNHRFLLYFDSVFIVTQKPPEGKKNEK